jgi:hypothetical protein
LGIAIQAHMRSLGVVIIFDEFFYKVIAVLLVDWNDMIQKLSS